ncbi:MAG: hypothetical protein R6V19_03655 [Armatimonadota bacterium]
MRDDTPTTGRVQRGREVRATYAPGKWVALRYRLKPGAYDVTYWHRRIREGYRQRSYLDAQYIDACSDLLPLLRDNSDLDVSVASDAGVGKIYSAGDDTLVMVANWELHRPAEATISTTEPMRGTDLISGEDLGRNRNFELQVAPADWRILKLEP